MKAAIKRLTTGKMVVSLLLFITSFIIFFITSDGNTPYNYFTRLSDAWIHGRLYLTEAPVWLSELIPMGDGKWLVPYSPMPALVAIPFVFIFGINFPQQWIAHLVGAGIVVLTFLLAKKAVPESRALPLWAATLSGVGTIMWYEAATGSSWFLGQITATFFLFLALLLGEHKKPFLVGLCLGAAYLARVHILLSLPVFIFLLEESRLKTWKDLFSLPRSKQMWLFFLGLLPALIFGAWYNFARFGVVWDKGYLLIPGVLDEPWFSHGIEHPIYIPRNIITAFWSFPKILTEKPFIQPSWNGLAIWITTPAFIYALWAPFKTRKVLVMWTAIALILLFVLGHGSNGFAQFGYRFAIDFYPFLIYLTILGVHRMKLRAIHWILLILGIVVNLWGVVWINVFGWVGF